MEEVRRTKDRDAGVDAEQVPHVFGREEPARGWRARIAGSAAEKDLRMRIWVCLVLVFIAASAGVELVRDARGSAGAWDVVRGVAKLLWIVTFGSFLVAPTLYEGKRGRLLGSVGVVAVVAWAVIGVF